MDGSEIRDSIGLQYFAEDGNTSDTGADMDGFDESEFLAALEGSDAEDQRGTNEGNEENVQDGAGRPARRRAARGAGESAVGGRRSTAGNGGTAGADVPLVFNGQQILLPADAVQALTLVHSARTRSNCSRRE